MKLKKRFAAMGAAMVMAVSMMGMGASANWSDHYIFSKYELRGNYTNNTTYREIKTRTRNTSGYTIVVGARASYLDSSGAYISTSYSTASKSNGNYHTVTNQGSISSSSASSYHYSEIYNANTTMSGIAASNHFTRSFTYTYNDGYNWNS